MKKVLSLFLSVLMLTSVVAAVDLTVYADTVDNGKCGDNLTWSLDSEGVLTINGEGKMFDFDYSGDEPWYVDYRNDIYEIIIQDGVTSIGDHAFDSLGMLAIVTIPNSVNSIGRYAFYECNSLRNITIHEGVAQIEDNAFCSCSSLLTVTLPISLTKIGSAAFCYCKILSNVYYEGSKEDWNKIYIGSSNQELITANIKYNYQAEKNPNTTVEEESEDGSDKITTIAVIVIAVALVLLLMLATAVIVFVLTRRHYKKHN